jgi:hypothetical protein
MRAIPRRPEPDIGTNQPWPSQWGLDLALLGANLQYGQKTCVSAVGEGLSSILQYRCDLRPQAHTVTLPSCEVDSPSPGPPAAPVKVCVRWVQALHKHLRAQGVQDARDPKIAQPPRPGLLARTI